MTNHPNRGAAFEVRHDNGKFSTVRGKEAALRIAREHAGCDDAKIGEDDLRKHWGVRITKLSAAEAKARAGCDQTPRAMQIADDYIADLRRCENVTRCYGNQRKAKRAAYARLEKAMLARGYSVADVKQTARDCQDVYNLECNADD